MPKSTWGIGAAAEKRIMGLIEEGDYNGEVYTCHRFPKQRFSSQDLWGSDIICVNPNGFIFCQVKYQSKRKPALTKKIKDELLRVNKPDNVIHLVARIDGRNQQIYWDEL